MRTLIFYPLALFVTATSLVLGFVVSLVPGSRPALFFIARRYWAPTFLWAAGAKLTVTGDRDALDPDQTYIFVANHASYLDIPALFRVLHRFDIAFVAKRELIFVPLLGWYMWRLGCPIVDRGRHDRALKTMGRAARAIHEGTPVFVFAEGTRTRDGRIRPFKRGAAVMALQARVALVPVTIHGTFEIMSKVRFAVRGGPVRVHIGAPIPVDDLTIDDRGALTERLHDIVEARYEDLGGPPLSPAEQAAAGDSSAN